ncbi:MAG: nucleotide-binding protein [Nitrospira sp. BO4]|nr:nucleotide-binding protein [Nitrospira sp. BO4]
MRNRPRVFISASDDHHLDENQLEVKHSILHELEVARGFEPWRSFEKGPLRKGWGFEKANEAMGKADGTLVLAFAQWECKGLGPRSHENGLKISEGNHLEGGLAIAHDLPLLVVREEGVQDRGIVSEGTTHEVVRMPRASNREWVSQSDFMRAFIRWSEDVEKHSRIHRERRVFIGHGHSPAWKDLRNYIEDTLHLSHDEFSRIPVAGVTTVQRLTQMLDEAGIAFLVMTAEDEQKDGRIRARSNVVHEAGLVQGRLGFHRAILLLEEGCETFSNIHGLGHITFSKGKIASSFDEVRSVLRREDFLD